MGMDARSRREYIARWSVEQAIQASTLGDDDKMLMARAESIYEFVEKKTNEEDA